MFAVPSLELPAGSRLAVTAASVAVAKPREKTVKSELDWRTSYQSRRQAEKSIGHYIDGFYNPRRRHSAIGYKSPIAFESKMANIECKASLLYQGKSITHRQYS